MISVLLGSSPRAPALGWDLRAGLRLRVCARGYPQLEHILHVPDSDPDVGEYTLSELTLPVDGARLSLSDEIGLRLRAAGQALGDVNNELVTIFVEVVDALGAPSGAGWGNDRDGVRVVGHQGRYWTAHPTWRRWGLPRRLPGWLLC